MLALSSPPEVAGRRAREDLAYAALPILQNSPHGGTCAPTGGSPTRSLAGKTRGRWPSARRSRRRQAHREVRGVRRGGDSPVLCRVASASSSAARARLAGPDRRVLRPVAWKHRGLPHALAARRQLDAARGSLAATDALDRGSCGFPAAAPRGGRARGRVRIQHHAVPAADSVAARRPDVRRARSGSPRSRFSIAMRNPGFASRSSRLRSTGSRTGSRRPGSRSRAAGTGQTVEVNNPLLYVEAPRRAHVSPLAADGCGAVRAARIGTAGLGRRAARRRASSSRNRRTARRVPEQGLDDL